MMGLLRWLEATLPNITITVKGKKYLTRCYFFLKDRYRGNTYLHHFLSSDQGDELHNHPWRWGVSLVLAGGYVEERARRPAFWEEGRGWKNTHVDFRSPGPVKIERRVVRPWTLNFIRSSDFHRVDLLDEEKGAWTLFIAGPRVRTWGFLNRHTSEFTDFRKNPEAIP